MAENIPVFDFQAAIEKCELCQEEDAQFYCKDCQEEMCSGCKTAHLRSKASRSHNVISSSLGKSIKKFKPVKCETHPSEIIRMYCINCDEAVCVKCIADTKHKNHNFEEPETTLHRHQEEISQTISETKQQIAALQKSLYTIDANVKGYIKESEETINGINKERNLIKLNIDKKADGLVDQVKKQKEQDLELVGKEKKDIQKMIHDQNEYLQSCEEKLKSMNDITSIRHEIKKPKSNAPSVTHIKPQKFASNTTLNYQDMFGKLVDSLEIKPRARTRRMLNKEQKTKAKPDDSVDQTMLSSINTAVVTKINPDVNNYYVSAVNDKEAWCGGNKDLVLVDIHGHVTKNIKLNTKLWDIAVTPNGELFVTKWDDTNIRKYSPDGNWVTLANTKPYLTHGLCVTSQQDILVCLYNNGDSDDDDSKVVRMTTAGRIKQTIQRDSQPFFPDPWYVAENINGDVIVVNDDRHNTIAVVNKEGKLRYYYPDSSAHSIKDCDGVACDNTGCILVSDRNNHRIHQIDINGKFLQFILTQKHGGLYQPKGLSIDTKGQLWLCNRGGKEIVIFKYRS